MRFGVWLSLLLHKHGTRIIRMKGLLGIEGVDNPVVINGVQHIVHTPYHLARWPEGDPGSKLVFISRGMKLDAVQPSFERHVMVEGAA
jgi:G3E family GTPase